ncbi:hypothetical protein Tco_0155584 [Tanacetum coccineum]
MWCVRSNGQRRYFSTLMRVLSIFDRDDLCAVYQLVMDKYKDEILEDFDKVLWGDLMIMFNPSDEDEFWNSQQDWNVVSWKLHGSSGVHTLMTEAGLVIHMLVEKKYHLRKNICFKLLDEVGLEEDKLAIPEQTATGKGTSNPLMAGSLPKTTKPT